MFSISSISTDYSEMAMTMPATVTTVNQDFLN